MATPRFNEYAIADQWSLRTLQTLESSHTESWKCRTPMSHPGVRQMLTAMNPSDYVATQRQGGRSGLDSAFVQKWAEQYRDAVSELKRPRLRANLAGANLLAREITYPMAMQEQSSIPSYYPYTCVNILDWYMDDCQGDLEKLKVKSIQGIIALSLDLGRFEMHSLIGYEPFQTR